MENPAVEIERVDAASVRLRVLERVRFEQSMGIEFLPRVALAAPAIGVARAPIQSPVSPPVRVQSVPAVQAPPVVAQAPRMAAPSTMPAQPAAALIPSADKAARWHALEAHAMACVKCGLHQGRTNVVFGDGNRNARLVFVGEGPGQDEDLQGLPFVGKAGQLLNKIIAAMGFAREEVYICNVVKCRPPQNRTPLPDEIAACSPYLVEQIELVAPKAIVALGAPAAKTLLNTATGITQLRGRWHSYKGIPVMPTFHPAFVLRTYTDEVRRQVWDDMKKVMDKLNSPK